MNVQTAAQYLPLVKALAEGKTIQLYTITSGWLDVPCADWSCPPSDYRIKPAPREFWIVGDGQGYQVFHYPIVKSSIPSIHVREVIP